MRLEMCSVLWQPSDMISHSSCRVLFFDVSLRISTMPVGLAFRCMCTSCTDRSRPRIGHVLHVFTLESASVSLTSLPGTYLMLTSYCCMRSSTRANLGGGSEEMFGVYGLKRFMVHIHFHVTSIDVLVESLKSKHDSQHFAFNVGVATFCFSQRFTGECDGAVGLQQCSPESYL